MQPKSRFSGPIPSPEQLFQTRLAELDSAVAVERSVRRRFVKMDGVWKVLYYEQDGVEVQDLKDDPMVGMLTLAESAAKNLDIDLETFWQMTMRDSTFSGLHTSMEDPVLLLKIKATLEEIFNVPFEERVYSSQYSEIMDRFTQSNGNSQLEESYTASLGDTSSQPKRRKKARLVGALMVTSVLIPAACSAMDDGGAETLPPLLAQTVPSTNVTITLQPETTLGVIPEQTTSLVATTVSEATTTVATPSTTILPVEVLPPPTPVPPETTPPAPARQNDGVLSAENCAKVGGTGVRFYSDGPNLWDYMIKRFGLSEGQVNYLLRKTDMTDTFHIRDIYGSTAENQYYECVPVEYHVQKLLESYSGQ